jgi:hypothetical protein
MNKTVMALTAATVFAGVGTAGAVETFGGKKGVGVASAIGGPSGLAFNFGMGNLAIEGILGLQQISPDDGDGSLSLGLGAGAHFAVLRSENAAFTVGGRLNIGLGKNPPIVPSGGDQESFTQIGVDIPMRVYWFADKHFSLHFETGLSIVMTPEKGALWGGAAGPKGMDIIVFANPASRIGGAANLGATFWW